MSRKPRSDSPLDSLPASAKAQLREWLLDENLKYPEVVALVREKLGVTTSKTALQRYYALRLWSQQSSQASEFADLVVAQAAADPAKYDEATLALVRQKAFERAYARSGDVKELALLAGILGDSAALELKRKELALREDQQALRLRQYEDKFAAVRAQVDRAREAAPADADAVRAAAVAEIDRIMGLTK
jgi:hypothetical protein